MRRSRSLEHTVRCPGCRILQALRALRPDSWHYPSVPHRATAEFGGLLVRRRLHENREQDGDDRDYDQQFNERKCSSCDWRSSEEEKRWDGLEPKKAPLSSVVVTSRGRMERTERLSMYFPSTHSIISPNGAIDEVRKHSWHLQFRSFLQSIFRDLSNCADGSRAKVKTVDTLKFRWNIYSPPSVCFDRGAR